MNAHDRHQTILHLLERRGRVTVSDLAAQFAVSEMTVRRDLDALERQGLLRRVRGGAVSARGRSYEPPFLTRSTVHQAEKERIGRLAAGLVQDGDSIALDVGTTALEIARCLCLSDKRNLTVVTPSFRVAGLLAEQPDIRIILTGGILRPGELSLVGQMAEQAFERFYVDKLFLGIGGVSLQAGLTEYNLEDAQVKQAMIRSAKEIILVTDSSKFDQIAFAAVAPLEAVDRIVTDEGIPSAYRDALEARDIQLLLA